MKSKFEFKSVLTFRHFEFQLRGAIQRIFKKMQRICEHTLYVRIQKIVRNPLMFVNMPGLGKR
jgi:hypothetical protein